MKLSATRSAESTPRACPVMNRIGVPGVTGAPSGTSMRTVIRGSICRNASTASGIPAITPVAPRAINDLTIIPARPSFRDTDIQIVGNANEDLM